MVTKTSPIEKPERITNRTNPIIFYGNGGRAQMLHRRSGGFFNIPVAGKFGSPVGVDGRKILSSELILRRC